MENTYREKSEFMMTAVDFVRYFTVHLLQVADTFLWKQQQIPSNDPHKLTQLTTRWQKNPRNAQIVVLKPRAMP